MSKLQMCKLNSISTHPQRKRHKSLTRLQISSANHLNEIKLALNVFPQPSRPSFSILQPYFLSDPHSSVGDQRGTEKRARAYLNIIILTVVRDPREVLVTL